jgi:hypothetical protein
MFFGELSGSIVLAFHRLDVLGMLEQHLHAQGGGFFEKSGWERQA